MPSGRGSQVRSCVRVLSSVRRAHPVVWAIRCTSTMTPRISSRTAELLGLNSPMNVDFATWDRVTAVLDNAGQIEAILTDPGFEMVMPELNVPAGRSVRPSIRTLERVGVMRRFYRPDKAERQAIKAAIDSTSAGRLITLGEMTFAGMPPLTTILEEDQLCRYLSAALNDQMKMTSFLAEVRAMIRAWTRRQAA